MSPCQKLHIFLDSVNVDVNEFEIYRPYLQIEYDVLKDTDGFHIFQFTYIPDLSRENTDIGKFI